MPCSPACANWLRGIQPDRPRPGLIPGPLRLGKHTIARTWVSLAGVCSSPASGW